jgi:hypothetical protein
MEKATDQEAVSEDFGGKEEREITSLFPLLL